MKKMFTKALKQKLNDHDNRVEVLFHVAEEKPKMMTETEMQRMMESAALKPGDPGEYMRRRKIQ